MIDINELRQSLGAVTLEEISELLDCLDAAEKERDALRAELLDAKETVRELFHGAGVANMTIATLQARVEAMEKQEPVGEVVHNGESAALYDILEQGTLIYLAPGAKGE